MSRQKKVLSVREARATLPDLEAILEEEGEVIIARRGQPIARVLPMEIRRNVPSHARLRAEMPVLRSSQDLIREDRDER
jgi:antitoxin (DNA-binding transcriptional repressor) of toxin-antitoxin stability system